MCKRKCKQLLPSDISLREMFWLKGLLGVYFSVKKGMISSITATTAASTSLLCSIATAFRARVSTCQQEMKEEITKLIHFIIIIKKINKNPAFEITDTDYNSQVLINS